MDRANLERTLGAKLAQFAEGKLTQKEIKAVIEAAKPELAAEERLAKCKKLVGEMRHWLVSADRIKAVVELRRLAKLIVEVTE